MKFSLRREARKMITLMMIRFLVTVGSEERNAI
jgi:hypothetical protein